MDKLKSDLELLNKYNIIFHSTMMVVEKTTEGKYMYNTEYKNRIIKKALYYPKYRDVTLTPLYDDKKNGSLIFTGEVYDLIGIDVDNKDDTMQKYRELSIKYNNEQKTLTIKTINNGIHEYYKLSSYQKEQLKNFRALNGDLFELNIDVKYNNQLLYGPSMFGDNNEFRYEIINNIKPIILPDYIFNELIKKEQKKLKTNEKSKKELQNIQIINYNNSDYEKAKELLLSLDNDRSDNRDKWYKLGCCLHNIDERLLDDWILFSQKSEKFKNGECQKLWGQMKNEGLRINTLYYWAIKDSKKNKTKQQKKLDKYIKNSCSMTHDDIAKLFYYIQKEKFVCAQEEPKNIWYKLVNGIWQQMEGDADIRNSINTDLIEIYRRHTKDQESATIQKIIEKLKNHTFVTKIIKQSIIYFKHDKFIEKLDTNPNILCFGENLYDLQQCMWRKTKPDDYCSLKCGMQKEQVNNNDQQLLDKILLDIFQTEEKKQYMINCFSMMLKGTNEKQIFYVWMGKGANGKSVLQNYFKVTFGDYFCDLPTTLITEKENKANEANPELCRGKGKRIAFFSEPEEGSKLNNSIIKKWTGGERITCRGLYENPYQYDIMFSIIILCNTKFQLQDVNDDSMPRRCKYVDFKTKFDYNPQNIFQKLRNDMYITNEHANQIKYTFMHMLLTNYTKLKNNNFKFDIPQDIINDNNEFINSQDKINEFVKIYCTITDNEDDHITVKDLWHIYTSNNKENIKLNHFKERIIKYIPFKERYKKDNVEKRSVLTNIKFNRN